MRGFGETTYNREDGWSSVADAVAVLDAAGVEQANIIACSMGGQVGIDLALAHPDRVAQLVLIGTAVRGAPYPDLLEGPTAELNALIESAYDAGRLRRGEPARGLDVAGRSGGPGGPRRRACS